MNVKVSRAGISSSGDAGLHRINGPLDERPALLGRRAKQRSIVTSMWLCFPVVAACLGWLYWQAGYSGEPIAGLPSSYLVHIGLNVCANMCVLLIAYKLRGEMIQKMNSALFSTVIVHGGLILLILASRLHYSRLVLLLAFFVSIGFVAVVLAAMEKWRPIRIGALPLVSEPEVWSWIKPDVSVVPSPDADVRMYDMILVDWSALRDTTWNSLLSRATLSGCTVEHVAKYVEARTGRVSLDHFEAAHASVTSQGFYQRTVRPRPSVGGESEVALSPA